MRDRLKGICVSEQPPASNDQPPLSNEGQNQPSPGQEPAGPESARRRLPGGPWPWGVGAVLLVVVVAVALVLTLGGDDEAKAQTVEFQQPVDVGPDPFVDKPADKKGKEKVKITPSSSEVGAGPFGGTGSDLVCDRDLLIKSLKARPERLAEWARVLGVRPTIRAVGEYIAKLHPVTLTRDTRVTNHSFVDGRAVPYQAILAAGTAVLVDDYGNPVARCRCGNPLLKPTFIPTANCNGCPPRYRPPQPCPYTESVTYRRRWYPAKYYGNGQYDEIFIRKFRSSCYRAYPDPPIVTITDLYDPGLKPEPEPSTTTATTPEPRQGNATASFSPSSGPVCRSYTLSVDGFAANRTLPITLVRPDGVRESYSLTTDTSGSGSHTFPAGPQCARDVQGTYNATVRDPQTGESATASVSVSGVNSNGAGSSGSGSGSNQSGATGTDDFDCNAPQSQLEFEECQEAGH